MAGVSEIYNAATTFIDENIARGPGDKTAIYYQDRGISYRELLEMVNKTGNALKELSLEMENRVVILLPDCPEFACSFFGVIKIGAVAVPVGTLMKAHEYEYLLNDSRAKVLIVHENLLDGVEKIERNLNYLKNIVVVGKTKGKQISFEEIVFRASSSLEAAGTSPDDVAFWLYTSGSTGPPKAAVHLQHDMIYSSDTVARYVFSMNEADITFSASKLHFAYGLGNSLFFPFRFGASTVLYPDRPTPEAVFEVINKYKPTLFFAVPTLYSRLLQVKNAEKKYDLSSVRLFVSSGEWLPPALFYQWREKFGSEILDVVGSTENLHDFLANRPGMIRAGSSGKPVPGYEAKIVDDEGKEVPVGQIGHLLIKGDSASPYYWNKHEATKKTMLGEWLRTGDTCYKDEEGYFWYCGRSDDMMKVSGWWVSPLEIENTLLEHPAVLEAAVAADKDEFGLVKPKAFVVVKERYRSASELTSELKNFIKHKLAPYKCPHRIKFVEDLPRTATGKIQRFKLRE